MPNVPVHPLGGEWGGARNAFALRFAPSVNGTLLHNLGSRWVTFSSGQTFRRIFFSWNQISIQCAISPQLKQGRNFLFWNSAWSEVKTIAPVRTKRDPPVYSLNSLHHHIKRLFTTCRQTEHHPQVFRKKANETSFTLGSYPLKQWWFNLTAGRELTFCLVPYKAPTLLDDSDQTRLPCFNQTCACAVVHQFLDSGVLTSFERLELMHEGQNGTFFLHFEILQKTLSCIETTNQSCNIFIIVFPCLLSQSSRFLNTWSTTVLPSWRQRQTRIATFGHLYTPSTKAAGWSKGGGLPDKEEMDLGSPDCVANFVVAGI